MWTGTLQGVARIDGTRVEVVEGTRGDDTRGFAPPVWPNTTESAYFLGVNRNKKSLTLDIAAKEGQEIIHRLLDSCDILVENFKVGRSRNTGSATTSSSRNIPG